MIMNNAKITLRQCQDDVNLDLPEVSVMRASRLMTRDYQADARTWVRENLTRLGWSQAELSRRLGKKDASYIGHSMRGARDFKAAEIAGMERLFGQSLSEPKAEHFAVDNLGKSGSSVSMGEIIASGFRETAKMVLGAQRTEIPRVTLPEYANLPQEAWLIEDDSADLLAPSGHHIIVVEYAALGREPRAGDIVVVKRYHPVRFLRGDPSHAENQIREIVEVADGLALKSLSSNPSVQDIAYSPDDRSLIICRLVIGTMRYLRY